MIKTFKTINKIQASQIAQDEDAQTSENVDWFQEVVGTMAPRAHG